MDDYKKDEDREDAYFPEGTEHKEVLKTMGSRDFVWDDEKTNIT